MLKSPGNKIKFFENYTLGIADVLLVYSMLSPIILLIIGAQIKLTPDFFRTLIVLLGPGMLAGVIYFKVFGIQVLKRSNWIILFVMLFTVIIFLSSIKHIDTELTRESLKFFIGYCLFGFCLGTISNMSTVSSKRFNLIWIIFITGFLIYAFYDQWPIINQRFYLTGIENAKIVNNAQVGFLFYFFALCVLFKFHSSMKIIERIVIITLLIACSIVGFYSGNRTTFFGFLISFGIYLFYYSQIRLNKIYPIIIVCFVIIVSLILLPNVNKSIKTRYIKAFEDAKKVISYVISTNPASDNSVPRLRIWKMAILKFKNNPVWGSGFGISYPDKISGINYVHPHNIIIELLAEVGIVGFFIFLILFGLIFAKAFLIFKQTPGTDRLTFFFYPLSLLFFFIYSSLHTDLGTEYFKWYFAGIIAGFDTTG
jgi:O-antigen ligase